MIVIDRITNKEISTSKIVSPIEFGQYFIQAGENSIINNIESSEYTFLVPTNDLISTIVQNDEKDKLKFKKNILLSKEKPLLIYTFKKIYEEMSHLSTIQNISALYRNIDEKLDITKIDEFIKDNLYHVEEICRNPAYKLDREIIKVPIARAKRVPVKAINYLASHTEDWARRRISGIEPKRIKSEVFNYDLKIYENKLTAQLIMQLIYYCNTRLQETKDTEEYFEEIKKIIESKNNNSSWYKKNNRDFTKLGKAIDLANSSDFKLLKTKNYLIGIQNRLFGLLSSDIYKENKIFSLSKPIIKRTNLLDNHQHYRFLNKYWQNIFKSNTEDSLSVSSDNNELCNAFVDFAWLLIYKSISKLGFIVEYESHKKFICSNEQYDMCIEVKKTDINNIEFIYNDKKIEFLPIPIDNEVNIKLSSNQYLLAIDNEQITSDNVIKISPAKINSEERVTKIIFEYILKEYIDNYDKVFDTVNISQQLSIIKTWIETEKKIFIKKENQIYIKNYITTKKESEFLNQVTLQKNNLHLNKKLKQQQLESLSKVEKEILSSKIHFQRYFKCISCGFEISNTILLSSYHDSFDYQCQNSGCNVHYGMKVINNKKTYFYHVKNYKEILNNNVSIEDAFGYEYIDANDSEIISIKYKSENQQEISLDKQLKTKIVNVENYITKPENLRNLKNKIPNICDATKNEKKPSIEDNVNLYKEINNGTKEEDIIVEKQSSLNNITLNKEAFLNWSATFDIKVEDTTIFVATSKLIENIPEEICLYINFENIYINKNKLTKLPNSIIKFKNLKRLNISHNYKLLLTKEQISWIKELKENGCNVVHDDDLMLRTKQSIQDIYSFSINDKLWVNKLIIWALDNYIDTIIEQKYELENIEKLNMNGNHLEFIPKEIGNLVNLRVLNCSDNQLNSLPNEIQELSSLEELKLWKNNLTMIPESIGLMNSLKKLTLSSNVLTSLPENIVNLNNITKLQLLDNDSLLLTKEQKKWINDLKDKGCDIEIDSDLTSRKSRIPGSFSKVSIKDIAYETKCSTSKIRKYTIKLGILLDEQELLVSKQNANKLIEYINSEITPYESKHTGLKIVKKINI